MSYYQTVLTYSNNDQSLCSSLAAVVSNVDGCVATVSREMPGKEACRDAFLVIGHLHSLEPDAWRRVLDLVQSSKQTCHFPEFVFIGDDLTISQQRELFDAGVLEVLESPINLRRLRYIIDSQRIKHGHWLSQNQKSICSVDDIESVIERKIRKIANVDTNILLSGETGVGKTYLAEKIHSSSGRAKHPFVVVNCGSIPANLVESDLFGHAKGAFTDATSTKIGQFEYAGAGTILLDEVDALSPGIQAKLLRVVENREFRRVGENKPIALKARIISATSLDLEDLVRRGAFRPDLYFRLNAYQLTIPKLCERQNLIEPLAHLFAKEFSHSNRCGGKTFDTEVLQLFHKYSWPGNLRELRNCVVHGAIDSDDAVIRVKNLPDTLIHFWSTAKKNPEEVGSQVPSASDRPVKDQSSNGVELRIYREAFRLVRALENNRYNRSRTAKELGVSRMTVHNMLKRHHFS